ADLRSAADEDEQRPGLTRGQAAEVESPATEQTPPTAAAPLRVDRHPGHGQRLELATGRAHRDLELLGDLGRGHHVTTLQHQQDRHESVGTHVPIFSSEVAISWPLHSWMLLLNRTTGSSRPPGDPAMTTTPDTTKTPDTTTTHDTTTAPGRTSMEPL